MECGNVAGGGFDSSWLFALDHCHRRVGTPRVQVGNVSFYIQDDLFALGRDQDGVEGVRVPMKGVPELDSFIFEVL